MLNGTANSSVTAERILPEKLGTNNMPSEEEQSNSCDRLLNNLGSSLQPWGTRHTPHASPATGNVYQLVGVL